MLTPRVFIGIILSHAFVVLLAVCTLLIMLIELLFASKPFLTVGTAFSEVGPVIGVHKGGQAFFFSISVISAHCLG